MKLSSKKRIKKVVVTIAALATALVFSFPAYAGSWKQDQTGWWWQDDDGSYPSSTWRWLDGNKDGWSECYYFDSSGYMALNTVTPDGNQVDGNGAWVVNGIVQSKFQQPTPSQQTEKENGDEFLEVVEERTSYRIVDQDRYETLSDKTLNLVGGESVFWEKCSRLCGYDGYIKMDMRASERFHPETLIANVISTEATLTIYGDNNKKLASYTFDYDHPNRTISVDVSGQNKITIKTSSGPDYVYFEYLHLEGLEACDY